MLIYARKYIEEHGGDANNLSLYGQDSGGSAWVIGKMNMILHGIDNRAFLENDDVLGNPAHVEADGTRMHFDRIYTGITHIHMQDQAITESMGDIVDHDFEHLAPSDQMITRTRRRPTASPTIRPSSPYSGCSSPPTK